MINSQNKDLPKSLIIDTNDHEDLPEEIEIKED